MGEGKNFHLIEKIFRKMFFFMESVILIIPFTSLILVCIHFRIFSNTHSVLYSQKDKDHNIHKTEL